MRDATQKTRDAGQFTRDDNIAVKWLTGQTRVILVKIGDFDFQRFAHPSTFFRYLPFLYETTGGST